jgi:hypothetical protein
MNYFYNHTFKNITVALMSLFDQIEVKRYDDNGDVAKTIPVPIKFGPQSKYYQRRVEDESGQRYYIQLPQIAIVPTGFTYDSNRSVSSKEERTLIDPDNYEDPNDFLVDMMPAPWDVTFSLYIRTEEFQDFLQIIEQIIPFFQPSVYLQVKEFNTINLERDIQVTLNSMTPEFTESFESDERREVNGTLDLTAKAWFYGPLTDAKVIRKVKSKYGFNPNHNMVESYITDSMPISATSAVVTSATVTTGTIDTTVVPDQGYVNLMED